MPRERMRPGDSGRITEKRTGSNWTASVYVRDMDGRRRRVERSSSRSAEDARRKLQRHLADRRAPLAGQLVTQKTTLAELFELWIESKAKRKGGSKPEIGPQTEGQYRACWRVHGAGSLGALRVTELPTSWADKHLQSIEAVSQAKRLRVILSGMFSLAVRYDVLAVNPLRETETLKPKRAPARAATPDEFDRIRAEVQTYTKGHKKPGPKPGRLLAEFIELLMATGCRPNEVLALRPCDIDLVSDPPTATVSGTLIDHNRIPGKPLHRQEFRKMNAQPHTVLLPKFAVDVLTDLVGRSGPTDPLFANRDGNWISLGNMRRALRAALPQDLSWVTPHSFRRTVATVLRDAYGPAVAQAQLDHSKLSTTETHYFERQTRGPDAREALDRFAEGEENAS